MRSFTRFTQFLMASAVLVAASVPVRAQDGPPPQGPQGPQNNVDDPNRGVARISMINGDVSVRRGDSGAWVAAAVNAPMAAEDRIATGPSARAEVQFDAVNRIRLAPHSEVRLTELSYRRYLMQVARGTVTFSVLRTSDADVEVDTPNVSIRPRTRGDYRITVREDGTTQATVRSGELEVFTPRGSQPLPEGKNITVRGTASDPEFQIAGAIPNDEWNRWNEARDRSLDRPAGYRYAPPDVYGVEDLDPYGSWVYVAPYGYCWRPTVAVGWAPYRQGRWVWMDWYGWTWVSSDPWGWAPYHYGRWFYGAGGWCWYPGSIGPRYYWRPGLVAFFGFGGGGIGVGFGFGHVGWVPLGPYEPFHAWWGRGYYGGYRGGVHVTNVNIINVYRNARIGNGVTAVSGADFSHGRFGNYVRPTSAQLNGASLVRGQVPLSPSAAHLRYSDAQVRNVPSSSSVERFASHSQPATVQRMSFSEQQRGFASVAAGHVNTASPAPAAANTGGWRRADQPASAGRPAANPAPAQTQAPASSTWRRAGDPAANRPSTPAAPQRPASSNTPAARSDSGGWNRFGGPTPRTSQPAASPQPQSQSPAGRGSSQSGGWGRFGAPGAANSPAPNRFQSAPGSTRQESLRVAPPVVRERAPGNNGSSSGGYRAPAPSSAPRSESRAPSGGGGHSSSSGSGGGHSSSGHSSNRR